MLGNVWHYDNMTMYNADVIFAVGVRFGRPHDEYPQILSERDGITHRH